MESEKGTPENQKLHRFLAWCSRNNIVLSEKLTVTADGTSHRFGVIATKDITQGELLAQIPRTVLLNPESSAIADRLEEFNQHLKRSGKSLKNTSGWIPLIVCLMHEYTDESSLWRPYLDLVPLPEECGHPMFWSNNELEEELAGLSLLQRIRFDQKKMLEEYETFAMDFIKCNGELKSIEKMNYELYKQMVAFIMAYSFTEKSRSPSMVPMADIFNHHSCNNAHLTFRKNHLCMMSTSSIKEGEEIFNTFGQLSNCELLHMYGFTESQPNPNDYVIVSAKGLLLELNAHKSRVRRWKIAVLKTLGLIQDLDGGLYFTSRGLSRDPNPFTILEILHMDERKFLMSYGKHFQSPGIYLPRTRFRTKYDNTKFSDKLRINRKKGRELPRKVIAHGKGTSFAEVLSDPSYCKRSENKDGCCGSLQSDLWSHEADIPSIGPPRRALNTKSLVDAVERNSNVWKEGIVNHERNLMEEHGSHNEETDEDLYTYDQLRLLCRRQWIVTIQSTATAFLAQLKRDPSVPDSNLTYRQLMARNLRQSQRIIIERILNCL